MEGAGPSVSLVIGGGSFQSIWYWILTLAVWIRVCHHTLGVPHDMVQRARRLPEVAARVDDLARLASLRIGGIYDRAGVPLAALAGFGLTALFVLGFASGLEFAKAAFVLLFPRAVVAYSTLRLALAVRRKGQAGEDLRRSLGKRRIWHGLIAWTGLAAAVSLALLEHAPRG